VLNRRQMLATTSAVLGAAAITRGASAALTPATQANGLYETFIAEILDMAPEFATSLGLDTGAKAGSRAKLSDRSLKGRADSRALNTSMLKRLKGIDRKALTGLDATNYDAVYYGIDQSETAGQRFPYGDLGNPYAVSQLGGAYHDLPDFLDQEPQRHPYHGAIQSGSPHGGRQRDVSDLAQQTAR